MSVRDLTHVTQVGLTAPRRTRCKLKLRRRFLSHTNGALYSDVQVHEALGSSNLDHLLITSSWPTRVFVTSGMCATQLQCRLGSESVLERRSCRHRHRHRAAFAQESGKQKCLQKQAYLRCWWCSSLVTWNTHKLCLIHTTANQNRFLTAPSWSYSDRPELSNTAESVIVFSLLRTYWMKNKRTISTPDHIKETPEGSRQSVGLWSPEQSHVGPGLAHIIEGR